VSATAGGGRTILACGPAHADVVAALRAECFDDAWNAESVRSLMGTPGTFGFLARDGDEPTGFILCRAAADECEILVIGVRPAARRHGCGRGLLDCALARAHALGAAHVFLEVGVDNRAARALYRARGFVEAGRRPAYYPHPGGTPTDALILRLALKA